METIVTFTNPGSIGWVKDRYIGGLGRMDDTYDNTLSEWGLGEAPRQPSRQYLKALLITLCVILPGGIFVLAALAVHKFFKERLCQ